MHQIPSARKKQALAAALLSWSLCCAAVGAQAQSNAPYNPWSLNSVQQRLAQQRQANLQFEKKYNNGKSVGHAGAMRLTGASTGLHAQLLLNRVGVHDSLDPAIYAKAAKQRDALPNAKIKGAVAHIKTRLGPALTIWQPVGPGGWEWPFTPSPFGGPYAGPVEGVAIDPANGNMFVASQTGGVWKFDATAQTWTPLTDFADQIQGPSAGTVVNLACSSVAIDPWNDQIVYAGTGDYDDDLLPGYGVLRSTDGGNTWAVVGNGIFGTSPIHRVVIDPNTASKVFACAGANGLFVSYDTGQTWTMALGPTAVGAQAAIATGGKVSDLVYNFMGDILYCVVDNDTIYVSKQGGAPGSWSKLTAAPSGTGKYSLVAATLKDDYSIYGEYVPNGAENQYHIDEQRVYVCVTNPAGTGTIYVVGPTLSTTGGLNAASSVTIQNFPSIAQLGYNPWAHPDRNCLGITHQTVTTDTQTPVAKPEWPGGPCDMDTVYCGTAQLWQSQDDAQIWQPTGATFLDIFQIVPDPNDTKSVYVASSQGLFHVTYTPSASHNEPFQPIPQPAPSKNPPFYDPPYEPLGDPFGSFSYEILNGGLPSTTAVGGLQNEQFLYSAYHPQDPTDMIGGTTTDDSLGSPAVAGLPASTPWSMLDDLNYFFGGGAITYPTGGAAINQQNGGVQYVSQFNSYVFDPLAVPGFPIYEDKNEFLKMPYTFGAATGYTLFTGDDLQQELTTLKADTVNGNYVFAGTNYLYAHNDAIPLNRAQSVLKYRQKFSSVGTISAIANSPTTATTVYAGTNDGLVWYTQNAINADGSVNVNAAFTEIDNQGQTGGLPVQPITGIAVSLLNPLKVYVTVGGSNTSHVWCCPDVTSPQWINISGDNGLNPLPDINTTCLSIMPENFDNEIFVGTEIGMFYTSDGGANWARVSGSVNGLPDAWFTDVTYVPATESLMASTFGRGMWFMPLKFNIVLQSLNILPNPVVGGSPTTGTYGLNGNAQVVTPVTITSSNPKVAQILDTSGNPQTSVTFNIPIGSNGSNFTISTQPVSAKTNVTITASSGGIKVTQVLTVIPVVLQSLTLVPTTVIGGDPVAGISTATLLLNGPATANITVNLSSSYPAITTFVSDNSKDPVTYNQSNGTGTVVIPKGATSGTFEIKTQQVQISSPLNTVTIGAKANGFSASAKLQVNPPQITSITFSSSTVNGGTIVTGTIRLNSGAPTKGGAQVQLFSNSPSATLPLQVVVPAGATTTTFKIYTTAVAATTQVTITGTYNGNASNVLTINP